MKNSKKFKLILMILICILIILVGFLGVYSKESNSNVYKNILPEYELASDLEGSTVLEFEVDTSSDTIYLDKDGKEVDSTTITEKNEKDYTKKEVPVNNKEELTLKKYKKVIEIMKKRLEFLQADQYSFDLDESTGKIVLTYEDDYPDDIKSFLSREGKLELVDSNTEDVILDYNDFENAEATYTTYDEGTTITKYATYINLKLNNLGIEKINNIEKYKTSTAKEGETTVNKFKITFDKKDVVEVSYDDILLTGKSLRITTATNLTTDSEINSQMNVNTIVSKLATIGKLPIAYNITAEEYINSVASEDIEDIITIGAGLLTGIFVVFIIKYKFKGLLVTLSFMTNIAIFLILIRLTNIQISLNGIAGMLGLIVLNIIVTCNILKNITNKDKTFVENIKEAYLNTINAFVIMLIIFVVFAFSNMTVINSMGLLVFWGWLIILVGNLVLTVPMLSAVYKK